MTDDLSRFAPHLFYHSREKWFTCGIDGAPVDSVYGRWAQEGPDRWAQFWMWYETDSGHDGDWEMIQVLVGNDIPIMVAMAQHQSGVVLPITELKWRHNSAPMIDWHPELWIANGTHACYSTPGWHKRGAFSWDRANGRGRSFVPTVLPMPEDGWPLRVERWGRDKDSPVSPGHHRQWRHPSEWAAKLRRK